MSQRNPARGIQPLQMRFVAAGVFAVAASIPALVFACGFCTTPSGLKILHPKSLDVAVAIRRDLDSGLLKRNPARPQGKANRFRDLQTGRILAERFFQREGFELLLIEDGAHYRIEPASREHLRQRRVPPPIRWVTGRAVLQSMLKNEMDLETAVKRGLVVVEKTRNSKTDSRTVGRLLSGPRISKQVPKQNIRKNP